MLGHRRGAAQRATALSAACQPDCFAAPGTLLLTFASSSFGNVLKNYGSNFTGCLQMNGQGKALWDSSPFPLTPVGPGSPLGSAPLLTTKNGEYQEIPEISQWVFNWCPIDFYFFFLWFAEFHPYLHGEYLFFRVTYSGVSHVLIFNSGQHSTGVPWLPELIFSVKQADNFLFSLLNPNKSQQGMMGKRTRTMEKIK